MSVLYLVSAEHVEPLRATCAKGPNIWQIYPVNMLDDDFDEQFKLFHGDEGWVRFAALDGEHVVGNDELYPSRSCQWHGDDRRHLY